MTASSHWARGSLIVVAALTVFCVLLNLRDPMYPGVGLDPSWIMAAEFAAARDLVFGRDFVFTYGPYHELATRMFDPQTFPLVLLYDALSVIAVFAVALRNRSILAAAALGLCFVFLQERGDSLAAIAFLGVFLVAVQRRDMWGPAAVAVCAPFLLSKLSFGLVLLPLVLLADVERLTARRAPVLTLTLGAALLAAYLLSGQPVTALPGFALNTLRIILGFGGAMQIEGPRHEIWYGLGLATVVVISVGLVALREWRGARGDLRPIAVVLAVVWVLFMLFKMGFVRQDGHTAIFHGAVPAVLALAWAYFDRPGGGWRMRAAFAALFAVVFVYAAYWQGFAQRPALDAEVNLGEKAETALQAVPAQLLRGAGWATLRWMPDARQTRVDTEKALARAFPPSVQGSVDVIPWELSTVIASGLDYRPRPVVQSYSSYSPALQNQDRAFFAGPRAPDTLLLRIEEIDGRLPSLALGPSMPVIGARYDAVENDPLGLVLRRRAQPRPMEIKRGQPQTVDLGSWATTPAAPGRLVMARIRVERTLLGRLVGFLFREPEMTITLKTAGGREPAFRFIPGMAVEGVAVSPIPSAWATGAPVFLDPAWGALGETVTGVKLGSNSRWAYGKVTVAFDEVQLAPGFGGSLRGLPLIAASLTSSDPKKGATFNGSEIFAHASTTLRASFAEPLHLRGVAGLHAQPPGTKPGNGVRFIVTRFGKDGAAQVVLDRSLPANSQPAPFDVQVEAGGALQMETQDLGNTDYDWSYWGQLELAP